jgi:diguanylate cyclase (GGDEF)-like protein
LIRILSMPIACASALSFFLSAVFTFLWYRLARLGEKPSRLYPLFAFLGLSNGVFLGAFCLLFNAAGNDLMRNIANRASIASASLVFPFCAHFYASYFGINKIKPLRAVLPLSYASAALFAVCVIPPWRFFLGWQAFPTSRWYTGCEYGPGLFIWGAWSIAMMAMCIAVLIAGSAVKIRCRLDQAGDGQSPAPAYPQKRRDRLLSNVLLSATSIAWFAAGILDVLTSLQLIDLPPLTWIGSFLIVTAIAFILCDEIATIYTEKQGLYREIARDPLTGSGSRAYFGVRFDRAIAESRRSGEPLYLILTDCDDFKAINDRLGHAMGDAVLKAVATELSRHVRPYDTVARYGGDEFLVMPQDISSDEGVRQLCARLVEGIAGLSVSAFGKTASVSCSIGAARLDPGEFGLPLDEAKALLIHRADIALYESKKAGKGRYTYLARPLPS